MFRSWYFIILLQLSIPTFAQTPEYIKLVKAEKDLKELFDNLYSDSLSAPDSILSRIQKLMPAALSSEGAMEFPWSKLDNIGVITSEDGVIRIFTWHVRDDPENYRYFGYIQVAMKKERIRLVELMDNLKAQRNQRNVDQSPEDWYGKLYYKIVTRKYRRKTLYTLMGMDFNNSRSNIKTVEGLMIQRNQPEFVKDLFFNGRDKVDRVVLEYSAQVAMSLNYDQELDLISFDHLAPFHPIYNSNYEFYGPDGSYDGLEFSAGTWILVEDLDARNPN
jgi:hypothetical protein